MAEIIGRVGIRNYVSPIPQASTLINGLIHAWNANGNANDSIGGLNGTLVNGTLADAAPKIGSGAFYFDGINDRITLADNSLNLNTDFTVSFWCKDAVGTNKTIIHNKYFANDANTSGWSIIYNGTGISFDITTAWVSTADIRHLLPNWNHVVVKYTRGVKMEIFLNGVLNATKNTTLTPTYSYTPIKTSIGTWNSVYMINGGPTLYPGTGLLDALNIWNRALTSAEITELYGLTTELQAPTPTYPASLKLFIDAGNALSYSGTGTTVTDLTGTQNGTLVNGTGWSSANGGTFTFDGINDYIDFGINTAIRPLSARTISMWVYVDVTAGASSWFYVDADRAVSGLKGIEIWLDTGGYRSVLENNSSYQVIVNRGGGKGVWLYLTTSWNGTSLKSYYNGILNSSVTQTIIPTAQTLTSTKIGTLDSSSGNLKGNISQMKIYNVQRSDAEILTDFNEFKSRYGY